jgi:hypothetical protein
MRTTENNNQPRLSIEGGGKIYQVKLGELTTFLDTCRDKLQISSMALLETDLQNVTDLIIEGTHDDLRAGELKRPLQLIREITFLFKGLLYERMGTN